MNKDLVLRSVFNVMTRQKRSLTIGGAVFAIVLFCFTGSLFAQSVAQSLAQSLDQSSDQETQAAESAAPKTLIDWADFDTFDTGYESSVAMHPSGLIVEVHSSGQTFLTYNGLFYRIGKLDPTKGTVAWGPSRRWVTKDKNGSWPAVAITKEGYAILTYSNAFTKSNAVLRYSVGTLDLNGGTDQLINFKVQNEKLDTGFHDSISVNYNGTIAEAHEADGKKGMYYRLGHLKSPASGNFNIVWDSGDGGQPWDDGVNPQIAINDNNDVVEVHQASANDHRLHYTRAKISGNRITFGKDHPFFSAGERPAVTLLNNGYLVEMHASNYDKKTGLSELRYRAGTLDRNNATLINWPDGTTIGYVANPGGIGTNGAYLVSTAQRGTHLYYSWAIAP
jgi:hypothetical protein